VSSYVVCDDAQYSIDCSPIEYLPEGTRNTLEDGNVMPEHVVATIHNK
jgi:hypothetical protein